jgi:hypothetical protein
MVLWASRSLYREVDVQDLEQLCHVSAFEMQKKVLQ